MANISESPLPDMTEMRNIPLAYIGERYKKLRIINPEADSAVFRSMEKYGQVNPVIVSEISANEYQLLDGFKRLRGAKALGMEKLKACIMHLTCRAGKAAIVQLNWLGKTINSMEEALVVHSLFHEDNLSQVEIATMFGRHKSWVCRRIALVERLCDEGLNQIKIGLLPISMSRELIKLPRGNQEKLLEAIHKYHFSCRDTKRLVEVLQTRPEREHEAILDRPWEVLRQEDHLDTTASNFFSPQVRLIHREFILLEQRCLSVSYIAQTTVFKQFEEKEERFLLACCSEAICFLEQAGKELQRVLNKKPGDE